MRLQTVSSDAYSLTFRAFVNPPEQVQSPVLEWLQVAALLLPDAIPDTLFQQEAGSVQRSDEEEPASQKGLVQALLDYELINVDNIAATLSMHARVQDVVRRFFALVTNDWTLTLFYRFCIAIVLIQADP